MRQSLVANFPYMLIGIGGAVMTMMTHQGSNLTNNYWGGSFWLNAILMLRVTWEYLASLLLPLHLNNLYIYTVDMIQGDARVWAGAAILVMAGWFAWRQPLGRPLSRFAILWVAAFMLPVANLFPFSVQRADRYLYQPSVMLFLLVGVAVVRLWQYDARVYARRALAVGVGLIILALGTLTLRRGEVWMNSESLWRAHLADYPQSTTGLFNLGIYYYHQKDLSQGYHTFQKLAHLTPHDRRVYRYLTHFAVADQRYEDAIRTYAETIRRWPQDKTVHNDMGYTYYLMQRYQEALNAYNAALTLDPNYRRVHDNLLNVGHAAMQAKDYPLARQAFTALLSVQPQHAAAIGGMCQALVQPGLNMLPV